MRALATIDKIVDVKPIEGADNIEVARVRDWHVVVRKNEFRVGDTCVYFEIDTMLPVEDTRFEFLANRGVKTNNNGFKGHVLKTIKLRGTVSQGLVLPIAEFPELRGMSIGQDVTDKLGVQKWEPPMEFIPFNPSTAKPRPQFVPKTDEERIQNVGYLVDAMNSQWTVTEKIDGTSVSAYWHPVLGIGVCSRNYEVADEDGNLYWDIVKKYDLHAHMASEWPDKTVVIQGELYGPKVQGNPLGVPTRQLAVFNVIVDGAYLPMDEWPEWVVPVPQVMMPIPDSVEKALADVDGLRSVISPQRLAEGVVWRKWPMSFKVINNKFLLKG